MDAVREISVVCLLLCVPAPPHSADRVVFVGALRVCWPPPHWLGRPGFCTETIVVKVNTSKGWDDEDSQKSLCQQVSESTEHHINPLDHAKDVDADK